jgi:outer membrane protein, heavy metal efflux system
MENDVISFEWTRGPTTGLLATLLLVSLAGCATMPPGRGVSEIEKATAARGLPAPNWKSGAATTADMSSPVGPEPITLQRALALAFERNPEVRQLYAELGIAQADVLEASRLSNPRLEYSRLRGDGSAKQVTRGIAITFTDLLLLPAKSRLAKIAFEGSRNRVSVALISLASEVEIAWYEYVNAQQLAQMRSMVATAANASAEYAQRLHAAGNITPRNFALELAAASEARIASARANAEAARARLEFANLLALNTADDWQTPQVLPAVPAQADAFTDIHSEALGSRLDLAAARQEVETAEGTLTFLRRWRWLGVIDLGYERETETDGEHLKGPTIGWELPLFNWNQAGVLRQTAELESAQARLAALELSIRNEVTLAANDVATAREVAESYRTALLPQREAVFGRTFEEFNFMLSDAFELLQAKREQFQAYEEYLESVRDFWIARARLRRIAGGSLPGDGQAPADTIGVESLLKASQPAATDQPADHSQHSGHTP